MIFSLEQINGLLSIIAANQSIFICQQLGEDYLSEEDKALLTKFGVDYTIAYNEEEDLILNQFYLGLLAESLGQNQASKIEYNDLKQYIKKGQYIPLTYKEKQTIESIKLQSLKDIKSLNGKIFSDYNQVLLDHNNRQSQENLIRSKVEEGIKNKQSVNEIARDIARYTGDWGRNFSRIVQYISHTAFEEGKAAQIIKQSGEEDPSVYKTVYEKACKHCIRLYLTNGIGSQPKIFKLSELRANGTNIGKKTDDWKPTLAPIHPYCRCRLHHLRSQEIWNEESRAFELPKTYASPINRKKVLVKVGDKEFYV